MHEDGYRHSVYKLAAEYFRIVKRTLKKMRTLKKNLTLWSAHKRGGGDVSYSRRWDKKGNRREPKDSWFWWW